MVASAPARYQREEKPKAEAQRKPKVGAIMKATAQPMLCKPMYWPRRLRGATSAV